MSVTAGFVLCAPWYARERARIDLRHLQAQRPVIQKYDGTDFVDRIVADPAASLAFGRDDRWSYPVAITPASGSTGREKFRTSALARTRLRKLYQPSHDRFYAVVVEVFCDQPGLPRAGSHDDIDVTFVMRRRHTTVNGGTKSVRQLARKVLEELAQDQHAAVSVGVPDRDVGDVFWADAAERERFEEDNASLFEQVGARTVEQGWATGPGSGWRETPEIGADRRVELLEDEEQFPMWRLPPRKGECAAASTRSLWFGLVPTYSSEHWTDDKEIRPKLDDQAIYQLRCVVTRRPARGREDCPPKRDVSAPTRSFRLASAYDPDGTKNHTVSITAPDLRRLAARAMGRQGPGGVRITSPPQSSLSPVDFKKIPGANLGTPGGGTICTFAFELFFIVALFLFLLFLPIVVLAFQLWWMLALRFCLPPSASFKVVADFFGDGHVLANLKVGGGFPVEAAAFDEVMGVDGAADAMLAPGSDFTVAPDLAVDLAEGIDPTNAVNKTPKPPKQLKTPQDPLCPPP